MRKKKLARDEEAFLPSTGTSSFIVNLIERAMPALPGSAWKVICLVAAKQLRNSAKGNHWYAISLREFAQGAGASSESGAGLHKTSILRAIRAAVESGWLERREHKGARGADLASEYHIANKAYTMARRIGGPAHMACPACGIVCPSPQSAAKHCGAKIPRKRAVLRPQPAAAVAQKPGRFRGGEFDLPAGVVRPIAARANRAARARRGTQRDLQMTDAAGGRPVFRCPHCEAPFFDEHEAAIHCSDLDQAPW